MILICYKNGSLTRDNLRKDLKIKNWFDYNQLVQQHSKPATCGIYIKYINGEIIPNISKSIDYKDDICLQSKANQCRALLEAHCISKFIHLKGQINVTELKQIKVTGGASCNTLFMQILADIFQCNVLRLKQSNSVLKGSAYYAYKLLQDENLLNQFSNHHLQVIDIIKPNKAMKHVYNDAILKYQIAEQDIIKNNK